jgi:hypothetical protein
VARRVLDEVGDHALEQHRVAAGERGLQRGFDADVALINRRAHRVERVLGGRGEINRLPG